MQCPKCKSDKTIITETTKSELFNYRRRLCNICFTIFKTKEEVYVGAIPKKKRLTKPVEKEFQKNFGTDLLKRFWK